MQEQREGMERVGDRGKEEKEDGKGCKKKSQASDLTHAAFSSSANKGVVGFFKS